MIDIQSAAPAGTGAAVSDDVRSDVEITVPAELYQLGINEHSDAQLTAVSVVGSGWPVLLLHHGSKRPAHRGTGGENHRSAWLSSPEDLITAWDAYGEQNATIAAPNVGVMTGQANRAGLALAALDVDSDSDELATLIREAGPAAEAWARLTLRVQRCPDRRHLYGLVPAEVCPPTGLLAPQLEWRGRGGYLLLPGSLHPEDKRYAITDGPDVRTYGAHPAGGFFHGIADDDRGPTVRWRLPLAVPHELLELMRARLHRTDSRPGTEVLPPAPTVEVRGPRGAAARVEGLIRSVAEAPAGEGNNRLNWAASKAAAICASDPSAPPVAQTQLALVEAYVSRPRRGRESLRSRTAEAERTVASGWRYGAADPELAADRRGRGQGPDHIQIDLSDVTDADGSVSDRPGSALGAAPEAAVESEEDQRASVRRRFPAADLAALVDPNRPPRRWLLEGIVPEKDHASLVAPAGTGKSLLALALAVAGASGQTTFLGRRLYLPGKVLYVDMENSDDDLAERLTDLGVTPATVNALQERLLLLSMPQLQGLDTPGGGVELRDVLDAYELAPADLLILDSTQRVTAGEENSNDTFRNLYRYTSTELKRRGLTVLRTDNRGWAGERERGASAKRDDVGYSWQLDADQSDPTVFVLSMAKHRARATGEDGRLIFRREVVDGRLTFTPTKSTFGDRMVQVHEHLEQLNVDPSAGLNAAWQAVKDAKDLGDAPDWITRDNVRKAQQERRVHLSLSSPTEASETADDRSDGPR